MSHSSRRARESLPPETEERRGLRTWAEDRATVLVATGILFVLVAIVIVISLIHPR